MHLKRRTNEATPARRFSVAAGCVLLALATCASALALRMDIQEETRGRTRTMATDGRSIFYHKDFVTGCSDQELLGLLAHEVMHPAMQHHTRRGDRDPKLWNEASDYAINPILTEAGFVLPGTPLLDPEYRGMTAEQIYEVLKESRAGEEDEGIPEDAEINNTKDGDSTAQLPATAGLSVGSGLLGARSVENCTVMVEPAATLVPVGETEETGSAGGGLAEVAAA